MMSCYCNHFCENKLNNDGKDDELEFKSLSCEWLSLSCSLVFIFRSIKFNSISLCGDVVCRLRRC